MPKSLGMRELRDAIAEILDHTTQAMVCRKVDSAWQKQRVAAALVYVI
jgi:hypothetical protein